MPLVFDDDSRASGGRLVFDDEVKKKPSTGIGEDLKNYGLRCSQNPGRALRRLNLALEQFCKTPAARWCRAQWVPVLHWIAGLLR